MSTPTGTQSDPAWPFDTSNPQDSTQLRKGSTAVAHDLAQLRKGSTAVARDLTQLRKGSTAVSRDPAQLRRRSTGIARFLSDPEEDASIATGEIPEGGYGWVVVCICASMNFWYSGMSGSWGVMQAALLHKTLTHTPTSTVSFVATIAAGLSMGLALFAVRVRLLVGSRMTAVLGVVLLSLGQILASFTTSQVGGLFACYGVLVGLGTCLCYSVSNTLPTQYFTARLGLASGVVKLGGGAGAAILSISVDAVIKRVGIDWTFRILGLCTLATTGPATLFIRERMPMGPVPFIDLSLFRDVVFTAIFCAGAVASFMFFVPPFFLPLITDSLGFESATGAALVAAFGISSAVGRFAAGWMSDYTGPVNMLLSTMALGAVSMVALWPVANSLGLLLAFAVLNGFSNGAFFTMFPVVVTTIVTRIDGSQGSKAVALGMSTTGWTPGYFLGVPLAGYVLEASGLGVASPPELDGRGRGRYGYSIAPYRPAILYAGIVAAVATVFVLFARVRLGRDGKKKV